MQNKYYRGNLNKNNAKRVPICFCVDTSLSMDVIAEGKEYCYLSNEFVYGEGRKYQKTFPKQGYEHLVKTRADKLAEGIKGFYDAICDDELALDSCVASIVVFNDKPKLLEGFGYVDKKTTPIFELPNGNTNLSSAIKFSLDILNEQKLYYAKERIDYYQPWLVLFTDGQPSDDIENVKSELLKLQRDKKLVVYICAVTDDVMNSESTKAMNLLKSLILNDEDTHLLDCSNVEKIKDSFDFFAKSISLGVQNGNFNQTPSVDFSEFF